MLSKRLSLIVSFVEKKDIVLDIGTDHGYVPIYLKKNKLCKDVVGSDVSVNAIKGAINNAKKNKCNVKFVVSDGLSDISEKYNTIIISGMGTSNIIKILDNDKLPKKIIISSNNNLDILRKTMNKKGYKIIKEKCVFEKKYYDIIWYEKGIEKLKQREILFGKSNDKNYYKYLLSKEKMILKKSNKKLKHLKNILILKKLSI